MYVFLVRHTGTDVTVMKNRAGTVNAKLFVMTPVAASRHKLWLRSTRFLQNTGTCNCH